MKILVFADLHGSVEGAHLAVQISQREQPNKTVVCGDIFCRWDGSAQQMGEALAGLVGVQYFVRGNNDFATETMFLPCPVEDYALMYHFGRKLFFTHGDNYNAACVPPVLSVGDAIVYGHSHVCRLRMANGLHAFNVGSLCCPRDGVPSYLVLDQTGATAKTPDGTPLRHMGWSDVEQA